MESKNQIDFDVIVIGLGCVGLSSTFYLSRNGLKVLGLEKNPSSGALGSGSYSFGRIWRVIDKDPRYNQMQEEALTIWREVEEECNEELLMETGCLYLVNFKSEKFN
jgi:sarcosine oxidase